MMSLRSLVALLACAAIATLALVQAAIAAPSGPKTLTYVFTNCTGPRTTYTGVKQAAAAAVHLTDGSGNFVFMEAIDAAGNVLFTTAGFQRNGLTTVTCDFTHPLEPGQLRVTGLLTPATK